MSDFIIDTPYHKRWWLPDRKHYYNSVMYGDEIRISIWKRGQFGELDTCVLSIPTIKIDDEGRWMKHCELAQALAEKKFAAKSKSEDYVQTGYRARGGTRRY